VLEVLVICLMVVLNGFFACSEFAIVSVRKSRIAQLVAEGDERARIIEALQQDPHRVLALVQVGVTVTGATASTIGGIIAVDYLRPWLQRLDIDILRHAAEPVAVTSLVIIISYLLLILGELVPKTIGLQYADVIALRIARPIDVLSRVGSVVVSLLTVSSKAVMKLLRISGDREVFITREEVQHIVAEGHESGVFSEDENEYIRNVFEFTHTCVREVMVPRTRIVGLELSASREEVVRVVLENMYSRYPVYRDTIEDVVGVVHGKDLLGRLVAGEPFDLAAIMNPPVFVPESKKVNNLLKEMQRSHNQMALVVDEYGGLNGLVTSEDLIEELLGEIRDEHDAGEPSVIQRLPDGSLLVDGFLSVFDLGETIGIKPDDDAPYDTVAGLILHELGRFPLKGEAIDWQGYRFTCEEVTRTAILRVRLAVIKE
jgi:magnesium and cobalt exporter, CNNM family